MRTFATMGERQADRVKASTLRKRAVTGRLTHEQAKWLDAYNARVVVGKTTRLESEARRFERVANSNATHVSPVPAAIDAASLLWSPIVPQAAPDAEIPPPGVAPPPGGTPIVDAAPIMVDESAAQQFAMMVAAIVHVGIPCALELSVDIPMPGEMRELLIDPSKHAQLVMHVAAAAHRIAIKYSFKAIPLTDEIVVGAALGGTALCWLTVRRRRAVKVSDTSMRTAPKNANVTEEREPPSGFDRDEEPPSAKPPSGFAGWAS